MPVRVTGSDPQVQIIIDDLAYAVALFAKAQSIANDAQWGTKIANIFDATAVNNAATLSDLRTEVAKMAAFNKAFFDKLIKIG